MTFARAWDELEGPRYEQMRKLRYSPLHVAPILGTDGGLAGYRLASKLHEGDWIKDLAASGSRSKLVETETEVRLKNGFTPWDVFERDACFLLENVFWAHGSGIAVDEEIVEILRKAQPDRRTDISSYAVFGLRNDGSADGRTGKWLEVRVTSLGNWSL